MRLSSNKKDVKVIKMKPMPVKKKKISEAKLPEDSLSETISFVIKGKLTPIKPSYKVVKNVGKIIKNKEKIKKEKPTPKKQIIKKTIQKSKVKLIKKENEKKIKDSKTETKVQLIKTAKKTSVQKQPVKKSPLQITTPPTQEHVIKKDTKSETSVEKIKKSLKDIKQNKEAKSNVVTKIKNPIKKETAKRATSSEKPQAVGTEVPKTPAKEKKVETPLKDKKVETPLIKEKKVETPTTKQEKNDDDIKTKQTIEKLLKQANKALKQPLLKTNKTKSKINKIKPNKNVVVSKTKSPKKVRIKTNNKSKIKSEICVKTEEPPKISEPQNVVAADDTYASDELTLEELRQSKSIKKEILDNTEVPKTTGNKVNKSKSKKQESKTPVKQKPKVKVKSNLLLLKKRALANSKEKTKQKQDANSRKLKLYSFWSGPKRHRVASLNALAKVHCLYENETRGNILDATETNIKKESSKSETDSSSKDNDIVLPTRTLRSVPGLRGVGKHWDMHDTSSSSSSEDSSSGPDSPIPIKPPTKIKKEATITEPVAEKEKTTKPQPKARKRNRTEIVMDLKDMVVRKRMASLNATAILAASYSVEKRASKSPKDTEDSDSDSSESSDDNDDSEYEEKKVYGDDSVKKEDDRKVIEVCATPNKKVAVILNQDTDVTITGVYVNSTTRSTHHEGYCSIAGMQYRISATSHTQTAATAVATETLLQSSASSAQENSSSESMASCKSYTPLDALSNMQPPPGPGIHQGVHPHMGPPQHMPMPPHQLSPGGRRHGCPSAFSTPHTTPPYPPPPHPAHTGHPPGESGYPQGYYQPAGPLITVPHGHPQHPPPTKSAPLSEPSPTSTTPPIHQAPPPAPSSNGDSSDSEVIITSVTAGKDSVFPQPQQQPPSTYRYNSQYSSGAPHPGYSYSYPPHYYPSGPPTGSYHHDFCYSPTYLPPKYRYTRYLPQPAQYYTPNPTELYSAPPAGPAPQSQQQVVTATPVSSSSTYQTPPSGPPLVESYTGPPLVDYAQPPSHYYPGYPAPPPACYTHSPTRAIPYINATYQSCPCPMQSCPKNVHTGPLTGDSKRSSISSIAKDSMPLPPVALALPMEPASATGPPSPARGSAGMPPPPSPAGATYQPPPPAPKRESLSPESADCKASEKKRKARVGKDMVRNTMAAQIYHQNTMLLMCNPQQNDFVSDVKREIESPKEKEPISTSMVQKKEVISDDESKTITGDLNTTDPATEVNERLQESSELQTKREPNEQQTETVHKNQPQPPVQLEPCLKTVAENVKVKNMKRKLSMSKEKQSPTTETVSPPPSKKQKLEKYPNGSYKDLIKKDTNTVKINNGRRKLIAAQLLRSKSIKIKLKPSKRKQNSLKENAAKKLKLSKPLTNSNTNSSAVKLNKKEIKEKLTAGTKTLLANKEPVKNRCSNKDLIKNKDTMKNGTTKKIQVQSVKTLNNNNSKNLTAATVLDNLFAKNSVDRTIECVISESVLRTSSILQQEEEPTKDITSALTKTNDKCINNNNINKVSKETLLTNNKKSTNSKNKQSKSKPVIVECPKSSSSNISFRRKSKCKEVVPQVISRVPRRSLHAATAAITPKWSNGWMWEGEPFESKIFLNSDETTVVRKCYPAMRHSEGDIIESRDCVLLKAGPRKNDLPFVAKIAYLWENPEDGEMMMSLLWYYRPEHTEQGRLPVDQPDEVFASRHKDSNSVACIDDKCYVLTFNEYCRYRKHLRRLEEGIEDETSPCIPIPEPYPRSHRQPAHPLRISPEMVFFCRRVYDFRQKRLVKNPS